MPVFEYVGRKLYCTAAGERLAQTIELMFNELGHLQTDLATLDGKVAGEWRLVAVNTAQYVVPYLLKEIVDLYPQVNVSARVVNRAAALKRLQNMEVPGFPLRRSWCVAHPKEKHPTPAMRAFLDYVQKNIRHFEQLFSQQSNLF